MNKTSDKQSSETNKRRPPEVFQVVVECRDEEEQRDLYERLRRESYRVRLRVL